MPMPFNSNADLHVLIVNDDSVARRLQMQLLRELGYLKISEAADGQMALRTFKIARAIGAPIDFVITDCAMPTMDGLTLIAQIRQDPQLHSLPVLMVTAEATKDAILRAAKAGADDYLVKPFTSTKLRQKIDALLTKYAVHA